MAAAAEGGFAGGMDLEVDGASVIYHRDRSVAWASKDVADSGHDEVRKAIKRARSVGWSCSPAKLTKSVETS